MDLLHHSLFFLILIIILGEALGKIEVFAFSFGPAAIIFVALIFGNYGYILPKEYLDLGLVLFIYSIGTQAGPGFLTSFKSYGLKLSLGAFFVVFSGFLVALISAWLMGYSGDIIAGAFAGALTSTPGLAVAVEMTKSALAPAAYGLTYSYGVIGVILFIKLLPKLIKADIAKEESVLKEEVARQNPPVIYKHIEITNPNISGKLVRELGLSRIAPVAMTRLLKKGAPEPVLVSGETRLETGDQIRIVGTEDDLERVILYMGRVIDAKMEFNGSLLKKRIVVSKKAFIGKSIGSINFNEVFNVSVSRLTRNGMDIPADPSTRLQMGDVIHLVGMAPSLENMKKLLGNDVKKVYTANIISILTGIFIGYLIGKIPILLPFIGEISLGTTGGVLIMGLLLSGLHRTGPIIWAVPETGSAFIREMGLVLFLATVGTQAGSSIVTTIETMGINLFLVGMLITTLTMVSGFLFTRYVLKIHFLRTLGVITGGMTSTPGLATTTSISKTAFAATAYATVYPVALISKILAIKFLIWLA
ncbi:MAG: transporter [Bacteroidetes bacterium]|nr:transporter [Bacteroidota bacterium]